MKKIVIVLLINLFLNAASFAATPAKSPENKKEVPAVVNNNLIDLRFDNVPVLEFVKVVFGEVLKLPYVVDENIFNQAVSLRISNFQRSDLLPFLENYFLNNGLVLRKENGIYYLLNGSVNDDFLYIPRYRSADYIVNIVRSSLNSFNNFRSYNRNNSSNSNNNNNIGIGATSESSGISESFGGSSYLSATTNEAGAIVISGQRISIEKVKNYIKKIDVPNNDVLIRVSLYEVKRENLDISAVDVVLNLLKGSASVGLTITNNVFSGLSRNSVSMHIDNFSAAFAVLSEDNRLNLISSPVVRVRSGEKARFQAGSDVPVLSSIVATNTSTSQSVEYKSAGVILELLPYVRSSGKIDLTLDQSISQVQQTTTGVNGSPTFTKRELKTAVTLESDEFVLLGGMNEMSDANIKSGFSFLPDFLSGKSQTYSTNDIVILLQVQRIN